MATILITGANRGLGLEFCKQYAKENWNVIACCRNPQNASDLTKLANQLPSVSILQLDVSDLSQISTLAKT